MTALSTTAQQKLTARKSADVKKWGEKYFLGAIEFIGVKRAGVDAVLKELPAADTADAMALLESPYMEMRQIGIELLHKQRKKLPDDSIDDLAKYFDAHVRDWATCDGLCSRVLREMIKRPSAKKRVVAWSRAKNTWRQRASAVAFVNEAKKGGYDDDIIEVCTRIVKNQERFVQLGCGWVLRELSLVDRPRVLWFIEDNATSLTREGLRYAVEKLPPKVRSEVMSRHAKLRLPGVVDKPRRRARA